MGKPDGAARVPGFVDLQVNGFRGVDFSDPELTPEAAREAFHAVLESGTAAFLPTVITSSPSLYRRNIPLLIKVMGRDEFEGRVLGLHLEGPFISSVPGAVGAHDPAYVSRPMWPSWTSCSTWGRGGSPYSPSLLNLRVLASLFARPADSSVKVSVGHSLYWCDDLDRLHAAGADERTLGKQASPINSRGT